MTDKNSLRRRNISWTETIDEISVRVGLATGEKVSELVSRLVLEEAERVGIDVGNVSIPISPVKEEVKGALVEIIEELQHSDHSSVSILLAALKTPAQAIKNHSEALKKSGKNKIAKAIGKKSK